MLHDLQRFLVYVLMVCGHLNLGAMTMRDTTLPYKVKGSYGANVQG